MPRAYARSLSISIFSNEETSSHGDRIGSAPGGSPRPPPVSKLIIATVIGLVVGFGAAVGLAWTTDGELFHPSGAIIKTDTQITRIYIPEGDVGVIYTADEIPLMTWTSEAWDGEFLNEVLNQAGCQLSRPCSAPVAIHASVTYANPKEGLVQMLDIEAP